MADPRPQPSEQFAATLRERAQRIIDSPQMPNGGSEDGREAWYWTHDFLAEFAGDVLALLGDDHGD